MSNINETSSPKKGITQYTNESKANWEAWRRDIDAVLSAHPDKLLTVVQERKMALSVKLRLRKDYKTLDETWDADTERAHMDEFDDMAYHIILPTIVDPTTRKAVVRKFADDTNAQGTYEYINSLWEVGDETVTARLIKLDAERTDHIKAGAKSASKTHMSEFVEDLLAYNTELDDTDYKMTDAVTTNHVLTALSAHDREFVRGFKGAMKGKEKWTQDFANVWQSLQDDLDESDAVDQTAARNVDALATQARATADEEIKALREQVAILTAAVHSRDGGGGGDARPVCDLCGVRHYPNRVHACLGEAISKGKITVADAAKLFTSKNIRNPAAVAEKAKETYEVYQAKKAPPPPARPYVPKKSVQLGISVAVVPETVIGVAPDTSVLAIATDEPAILKFDTQAEASILNDPRFFPCGVDASVQLQLTTITNRQGGRTSGVGEAHLVRADGTTMILKQAHLYTAGLHNVVATREVDDRCRIDFDKKGLHVLGDGSLLPFDGGYCAMKVKPLPTVGDATIDFTPTIAPRHPDAVSAILATGIHLGTLTADVLATRDSHFGGVTGGPRSNSGMRMAAEPLGRLYKHRTALGARAIKNLPKTTDAPDVLMSIPDQPSNDHDSSRANMPKVPAKAHGSTRTRTICFDLQGPFEASKHGNNRYCLNFYVIDNDDLDQCEWHLHFMPTKDKFPDHLETFLDSDDYGAYQLYTDNEAVLNSGRVRGVLKRRKMKPLRNSCEYEPWQNPAERPWRTLSGGSREFILRGIGETGVDDGQPDAYWPYAHQAVADVHNAARTTGKEQGRITHLRVPFCRAY